MQSFIDFLLKLQLSNFLDTAGELIRTNPFAFLWWLFSGGGWVFFVIPIPFILKFAYMNYIWGRWHSKIKYTLLAIDIPKENEQSIQAVEQMFYQFWTIYLGKNLIEKYIEGQFQLAISFEIVSIEGYTQFLIRTPEQHRDHVEAAIYAQFPNAEITEVEDYTKGIPDKYPNDEYDIWGTEFVQANNPAYPIRTYPFFEHQLAQKYVDPMAGILEAMSKIGRGEQIWMQLVVTPLKHDWHEKYRSFVKKLIGAKNSAKQTGYVRQMLGGFAREISDQVSGVASGEQIKKNVAEDPPTQMLYLSPGERSAVEQVEMKLSKPGFNTKFRVIYIAKKDVFNVTRGIGPIFGGLNQFTNLGLNTMVPGKHTITNIDYFFKKIRKARRQRLLMKNYKGRVQSAGEGLGMVFNTEELASIYHFPVTEVEAPGFKRIETKRGQAPIELPEEVEATLEDIDDENESDLADVGPREVSESDKVAPPENLPF